MEDQKLRLQVLDREERQLNDRIRTLTDAIDRCQVVGLFGSSGSSSMIRTSLPAATRLASTSLKLSE